MTERSNGYSCGQVIGASFQDAVCAYCFVCKLYKMLE